MKSFKLYLFVSALLILLFTSTILIAGPEELSDEQMTEVNVQEGIKNLDDTNDNTQEDEILENLASPTPGTELDSNQHHLNRGINEIELDNLDNQPINQNLQEQFSQQLFDQVLENNQ